MTPAKKSSDVEPVRSCIGCRSRRSQSGLIPLALVQGEVVTCVRGQGRGAWICGDKACIERAGQTRAFSRGFRSILPDADIADTLLGWLDNSAH